MRFLAIEAFVSLTGISSWRGEDGVDEIDVSSSLVTDSKVIRGGGEVPTLFFWGVICRDRDRQRGLQIIISDQLIYQIVPAVKAVLQRVSV